MNRNEPKHARNTATRRTLLVGAAGLAALRLRLPAAAQPPAAANRPAPSASAVRARTTFAISTWIYRSAS